MFKEIKLVKKKKKKSVENKLFEKNKVIFCVQYFRFYVQ